MRCWAIPISSILIKLPFRIKFWTSVWCLHKLCTLHYLTLISRAVVSRCYLLVLVILKYFWLKTRCQVQSCWTIFIWIPQCLFSRDAWSNNLFYWRSFQQRRRQSSSFSRSSRIFCFLLSFCIPKTKGQFNLTRLSLKNKRCYWRLGNHRLPCPTR